MEPKGVRLSCPDCTLSVVMEHEQQCPPPITKVVEGVPWCPNCDIPMKPVASVDTTPRPASPGLGGGYSFAERLEMIRDAQAEVDTASYEWDDAKLRAAARKKTYDAKVESLGTLINRLTSVAKPGDPKPILDLAEQEPACCPARTTISEGKEVMCTLVLGHEGPHVAHGSEPSADEPPASWPNDAEAMAPEVDGMCKDGQVGTGMICTRPQGHPGDHVAHYVEGDTKGHEASRWPAAAAVTEIAANAAGEELRARLADLHILVDGEVIQAWSLEEYDAVVRYVEMLESGNAIDDSERPAFLPLDIPDHVNALHTLLNRLGIVIGMGVICAWTPEQRKQAAEWAAAETEGLPYAVDRPEFIPAPVNEAPPPPRRRAKKQREAVHA